MELSPEQVLALQSYQAGKNIFLTGPGGSGKTELIRRMVKHAQEEGKKVQVCALTGCAAVLLACKAKTVHSFAGIGLANGSVEEVVRKVISNKYKLKNWQGIDILIIDEVSMMSSKIFEILDFIARKSRKQMQVPFGGIQVVFSGDFYQLPPVGSNEAGEEDSSAFCFESPNWRKTFDITICLKTIFRQTDPVYTKILNQVRIGKLYKSSLDTLEKQVNKEFPVDFKPTILLPRRKDAETINTKEINALVGESKIYKIAKVKELPLTISNAMSKASSSLPSGEKKISEEQYENEYNYLVNNIIAEKEIVLKVGAQVMCIANIDMESNDQVVNGSQGIVVGFVGELPLVQFNNGTKRTVGYHVWASETLPNFGIKQIPLIYAWAITIHKAQGVSLDMAQIDAGSNIFECGQTYVALSRVKSLEGLFLTALNPQKIKVNKKVQEFYASLTVEEK
jgi:ATP-dependent DNA helicase PIF1